MVNRGPSQGCRECRARKLKVLVTEGSVHGLILTLAPQCDGSKPQCQRCRKSRIECTGYDIFREQREVIWKAANKSCTERQSIRRNKRDGSRASTVTRYNSEEPLSYELAQCREQQALFFYFGELQPRLTGYWTDELAQLYAKASPSSLLAKAVAAFTCSITSLHPYFHHVRPLAIARYGECLQLVRVALKDSDSATADETLAAVILLGTFEVCTVNALL